MRDDPVAVNFSENLMRARKRADLSQEELAFRGGLHRTAISYLECGARIPGIDTVAKLAGALGIEPGELLAGIRWRSGNYRPGDFLGGEGQ